MIALLFAPIFIDVHSKIFGGIYFISLFFYFSFPRISFLPNYFYTFHQSAHFLTSKHVNVNCFCPYHSAEQIAFCFSIHCWRKEMRLSSRKSTQINKQTEKLSLKTECTAHSMLNVFMRYNGILNSCRCSSHGCKCKKFHYYRMASSDAAVWHTRKRSKFERDADTTSGNR